MGKTPAGKAAVKYEESHHYVDDPNGSAIVRFWPGNHSYKVWDKGYIDPLTGKLSPLEGVSLGGATSITGAMDKGEGLSYYYMYEMKKFLKQYFTSHSLADLIDEDVTLEEILKQGTDAHNKKSDRGKSVGTDAHWFVERYLIELKRVADSEEPTEFVVPEIPEAEEIMTMLRKSYITIINNLKPSSVDEYKRLPKLIIEDIAVQEAMWIEANMLRRSTQAAQQWLELHDIEVHGTEGTIYSRILLASGKYDADLSVTCSYRCGWCCFNGDVNLRNAALKEADPNFDKKMETGDLSEFTYTKKSRCMVDFKSSNASQDFPKGIYPNYLCQTGVYDFGMHEEHGIQYDAHLILNGSKDARVDKQGNEFPVFSSHFSFDTKRNRDWALAAKQMKQFMWEGNQEVRRSL